MPYTIIESTKKISPPPGSPIPKSPNLKNQANILISITVFIPYLLRKNGIVTINAVSDIWEIDIRMFGYLTPIVFAKTGSNLK